MNIPDKWREVLLALREGGFPEAIIAGGALRDLENGAEIKDVDVFVVTHGDATRDDLEKALAGFQNSFLVNVTEHEKKYENVDAKIDGVFDFFLDERDAPPFQIISCNGPKVPTEFLKWSLDRFDIGLCRIAYDPVGVFRTTEYVSDIKLKLLTIVRAQSMIQRQSSLKRVERLLEKYGDKGYVPGRHAPEEVMQEFAENDEDDGFLVL